MKKISECSDMEQLRKTAEAVLARRVSAAALPQHGAEELLYELQVHQIQLEMQNEALRQAQFELEKSRDRYMDFYDLSPVGYVTLNDKGLIFEINLTGAALLGMERGKLWHRRFTSFVTAENQDRWHHHFMNVLASDETLSCELALQHHEGSHFFARLDCLRLNKIDETPMVRIVLTDISDRIKDEEAIRKLAFYDALTQLPNRRLLNDHLEQAMAASKRSGRYGALLFLDLDNFKPLNDRYGHDMGDLLLMEVAHRLTRYVREMDTVARFGGDEFVVLLSELHADRAESIAQSGLVAEKIRTILAEPYLLKIRSDNKTEINVEHRCTSSIGVVLFINHETRQEDILKWADMAMYQAKAEGRNRVSFFGLDEKRA